MRVIFTISTAAVLVAGCAERSGDPSVTQAGSERHILQVGLVLDSPAADGTSKAFPQEERDNRISDEVLSVRIVPGLNESNLEKEQRIVARGRELAVEIQFKGKARQQLADFTRANAGKEMALVVDGKVFRTIKIGSGASDGWLVIPGDWTLEGAHAFCKRLNAPADSRREP